MRKSLASLKLENEHYYFRENQISFRCNECGGTFQQPILATVSSSGNIKKYYACPRCMTQVRKKESQKSEKSGETSMSMKKTVTKLAEGVKCEHFLGYLKKRPKDTPVPEECLTCDKMIECLFH